MTLTENTIEERVSSETVTFDDLISVDELYALLHKKPNIADLSLNDYDKIVKFCSVFKESVLLQNDTESHATIMFKYLLDGVSNNINMFTSELGGELGDNEEMLSLLKITLNKKPELKFQVIYRGNPQNNKINQFLLEESLKENEQVLLYKLGNTPSGVDLPQSFFTTFDDSAFRLVLNEETSSAVCNFWEHSFTTSLNEDFNKLLNFSERNKTNKID